MTGTAFDFKTPKPVRQDMDNGKLPNGYDHNFILGDPGVMRTAAEVCEPETGRVMTVKTDKPAIQLHIKALICGKIKHLRGMIYEPRIAEITAAADVHAGTKLGGKVKTIYAEVNDGNME